MSCHPGALSMAMLKAATSDEFLAAFECALTRIPLLSGYSPLRWKQMIEMMIMKRAGLTNLPKLRSIVLFHPDCNFAFKYIGREMMHIAKTAKVLAPEQYGSRKQHKAIDLAVNKTLTYDVVWKL